MKTSSVLRVCGVVVLAVGAATVFDTSSAIAVDGQPVVAGAVNTEVFPTVLQSTSWPSPLSCTGAQGYGLEACGVGGVQGQGTAIGVEGFGPTGVYAEGSTGVDGEAPNASGIGVIGDSSADTGIGVEGKNTGVGSAVYGDALGKGVALFGDTANGTGVLARSTKGNALDVRGKATFSNSGRITIAAGTASKVVTFAGVTTASMILATAQQDKSVYVRSAVPANGSFTIHLTGPAPTGGLKVSYFILN